MNITSYSREKIDQGLKDAQKHHVGFNDHIRLLFAPTKIDDGNFERVCDIYSRVDPENFDTVVIVEAYEKVLEKKLPMASNKFFETTLGKVPVNDYMRNEFCDEDDDFYIHDGAFNKGMSLFHQLMMLQCMDDDFSVVSVQIADEGQAIIKELAYVLEEVLASRSALLVFCCDLDYDHNEEFERILKMLEKGNESTLLNYLNGGESNIMGKATFLAGVLVANAWKLRLNFLNGEYKDHKGSLLTAYADRQKILF